ncbi:SH3 domain-containing protein [Pseudonocardia sp. N23]|uniref:SH3 domain-containing protein n=1 Tax=Pseudonocardia sp. N23 TaxID=1987376 RepID=UPI000BFCCE32|nr:SH3 domain-containing protein [Pseudonocardia sp. N23]GAY08918.1 putative secreted protein [Pseudonocardia sp. N23]
MRTGLRAAVLATVTAALVAGTVTPAGAAESSSAAATTNRSWIADLASGDGTGVDTTSDGVTLDASAAHDAPRDAQTPRGTEGGADAPGTGFLTLAPRTLDRPTDQVDSTLTADVPDGGDVTVDVRGRSANGGWTEWIPSTATSPTGSSAQLPEATSVVQSRLVLTGTPGAEPAVTGLEQEARPTALPEGAEDATTETAPLSYSVFATREGLVGGTTANGHVIVDRDHFVALPSRRALSPRNTNDYSVKVCASNGRCSFAPVWDIGPWNTRDDYWNPGNIRQNWGDLPQGVPQAQAAYRDGYNGGNDQFGRKALNPAGIDLADGVFWDDLGLKDNATVTVDYLWTGSTKLSEVDATAAAGDAEASAGSVRVHSAPSADATVVGGAADGAAVPVMCATGTGWLQIGAGQFLPVAAVPGARAASTCTSAG